jgi:molybdate transport system regulatory protein
VARLVLRIELNSEARIGGDAIRLLELIDAKGSISAAGRAHGLTFRRAWALLDDLSGMFKAPLVEARKGGRDGGGARLTTLGHAVVARFRAIQANSAAAVARDLEALEALARAEAQ